ncbi:hypothetical protein [Burkholderia contaminans]|uniref:hypothetical protein n=1 Tax=Burkholderia contaminans TaxID=488447 RepID=UPI00158B3F5B|nr:hypothetical protein [Burkholderia contaminans]
MTIPNETDFFDCLEAIDAYPIDPAEYSDRFPNSGWEREVVEQSIADNNFKLFKARNRVACEPSLHMVFDELSRRSQSIFDTVVMRWLVESAEYTRVYSKLFPAGFKVRAPEEIDKIRMAFVDWAFDRLCNAANVEEGSRFVTPARHYLNIRRQVFGDFGNPFRWIRGLVSAIREYHFSKSAELMAERRKTYRSRVEKAVGAIEVLRSIANDDVAMRVVGVLYDGRNPLKQFKDGQEQTERIDKMEECLRDMSKIDPDTLYPISRLDGTARARVFVYRMAEENWKEFQSSKAAQIADLMYLEGFDVQLDQRTIERQCANFDSMERKYWTQVRATKGGAAYMERMQRWRQLSLKK